MIHRHHPFLILSRAHQLISLVDHGIAFHRLQEEVLLIVLRPPERCCVCSEVRYGIDKAVTVLAYMLQVRSVRISTPHIPAELDDVVLRYLRSVVRII